MHTIYFDRDFTDDVRREHLYNGQLFVYSPSPSSLALCALGREMAEAAFAPLDPREAQYTLAVEKYAAILAELKPQFIHHPRAKACIQGLLRERGCDLDKTYFDVPRMRTSTAGGYLTTGIAYAFHPHRDTWYSAPMCQLNWWLPIYALESENAMAFHPRYWHQSIRNGSEAYNYQEWVKTSRFIAAQQVKSDTRQQPHADEAIELDPQVRVITPPGGTLIFSAAQLHSSVPNTSRQTRFSIDFRTVHLDDVTANQGAPNLDSHCTGTTMGDYRRSSDFATLPEALIAQYL